MARFRFKMIMGFGILTMFGFLGAYSAADDSEDHHNPRNRHNHNRSRHDGETISPVNNAIYIDNCGTCHFAYQPELLPAESWRQILNGTEDHFGDTVDIDEDARNEIEKYLTSNAANNSSAELPQKIIRSLKSQTPLRITDIPYIRKEHHIPL